MYTVVESSVGARVLPSIISVVKPALEYNCFVALAATEMSVGASSDFTFPMFIAHVIALAVSAPLYVPGVLPLCPAALVSDASVLRGVEERSR